MCAQLQIATLDDIRSTVGLTLSTLCSGCSTISHELTFSCIFVVKYSVRTFYMLVTVTFVSSAAFK